MKVEMKFKDPDELEASMTITTTVGEFRKISNFLSDINYYGPFEGIRNGMKEVVATADKTFGVESDGKVAE